MIANRPPRAIIYLRVSTDDQADSGFGLKGQLNAAKGTLEALKRDLPSLSLSPELPQGRGLYHLTSPGVWIDDGVSAHSVPLIKRPIGRQLLQHLEDGDVLICAKFDRTFRTVLDTVTTIPLFARKGVRIIFADQPHLDTGNASGKATINMWATMAQFSSDMTSERAKETHAIRAAGKELNRKIRHVTKEAIGGRTGKYVSVAQRWHIVLIRYYLALKSSGRYKGRDLFDRIAWTFNKRWQLISKPIDYMDFVSTIRFRTLRHLDLWKRLHATAIRYGWFPPESAMLASTNEKMLALYGDRAKKRAAREERAELNRQFGKQHTRRLEQPRQG